MPAATSQTPASGNFLNSPLRISCIIPTLGRGRVLCDTIEMLLEQSLCPHELIIVDQTPDPDEQTKARLSEWVRLKRIQWLRQPEPNASKARNAGALAATGEILLFLDDDIFLKLDFLESYAEAFARTRAVAVAGQVLDNDGTTVDVLPCAASDPHFGWLYFRKNYSHEIQTSFMMSGNVAIRRNVFIEIGGMDENYEKGAHREESDFAMRFGSAGYRFLFSPKCSIVHLGPSKVPEGGSRTWADGRDFRYFHHCVGDWYFNIKFARGRLLVPLLVASCRHFVFNRQSLRKPWRAPFALLFWASGFPLACARRLRGARTLRK